MGAIAGAADPLLGPCPFPPPASQPRTRPLPSGSRLYPPLPRPGRPRGPSRPPAPPLPSWPRPVLSTPLPSGRVSPPGPAPHLSPPASCRASRSAPRRPGSPLRAPGQGRGSQAAVEFPAAGSSVRGSPRTEVARIPGRSVPRSPGRAGASRGRPSGGLPGRGEVSARPGRSPGSGRELNPVCGGSESPHQPDPGPAPQTAAPRRPTGLQALRRRRGPRRESLPRRRGESSACHVGCRARSFCDRGRPGEGATRKGRDCPQTQKQILGRGRARE